MSTVKQENLACNSILITDLNRHRRNSSMFNGLTLTTVSAFTSCALNFLKVGFHRQKQHVSDMHVCMHIYIYIYIFILRLSAKLFVLLGLISGCNESSGISVLSYTTMLPYMSIFECASCLGV